MTMHFIGKKILTAKAGVVLVEACKKRRLSTEIQGPQRNNGLDSMMDLR
jgi:hypothetical protein